MICADGEPAAPAGAFSARHALQHDVLAELAAEVDDDVRPLGRPEQDVLPHDRLGQQAVAGADLHERAPVGEREVVRREGRRVQQPEPVPVRVHVEVRRVAAVDQDAVAHRASLGGAIGPVIIIAVRASPGTSWLFASKLRSVTISGTS